MEYRITLPPAILDPARLEEALLEADPAANFDVDPSRVARVARVATILGTTDLSALLLALGGKFADAQVEVLPTTCCGGCSG